MTAYNSRTCLLLRAVVGSANVTDSSRTSRRSAVKSLVHWSLASHDEGS